ncbi:hypothetical protein D6745_03725 [Candidatus Woesearchaeota archaeon]|nr:MAG: hypothetical protein D6745_03725 [Candidatus Woesearchaeota archaeon]
MALFRKVSARVKLREAKQREGLKNLNPLRHVSRKRDRIREEKHAHNLIEDTLKAVTDVKKSLSGEIDIDDYIESLNEYEEKVNQAIKIISSRGEDMAIKFQELLKAVTNMKSMMVQMRQLRAQSNEKAARAAQLSEIEIAKLNVELEALGKVCDTLRKLFLAEMDQAEKIKKIA